MSYVLDNGTRCYKNDKTGKVSVDNVSQEEADRRARQNQNSPVIQKRQSQGNVSLRSSVQRPSVQRQTVQQTVGNAKYPFSWGMVGCAVFLIAVISAFTYNHTHVSSAERAIIEYMNEETADSEYRQDDTSDSEYSDSSSRYLESSEIAGYTKDEIQLMINEIYARHGRTFSSEKYSEYFSSQDWYQPVSDKADEEIVKEFNEYERANIELLSKHR